MLANWLKRYRLLMYKTRLLSRIGAFVMVTLAISEAFIVIHGMLMAENVGLEAVTGASLPVVAYLIAFSIRFYLLLKYPLAAVAGAVSWWVAAIAVYACAEPNPHFYYFGIEWAGLFFVFFSACRFLYTVLAAGSKPNEFDSNR